jgi:hypothetical protein
MTDLQINKNLVHLRLGTIIVPLDGPSVFEHANPKSLAPSSGLTKVTGKALNFALPNAPVDQTCSRTYKLNFEQLTTQRISFHILWIIFALAKDST